MSRIVLSLTLIIGFGVCSAYFYNIYNKKKNRKLPKNWKRIGNVIKLYIYPLKSGRYLEQKTVECSQFGFSTLKDENVFQLKDRHFIIYGEADLVGKAAKTYPKMILISMSSDQTDHIVLQAPGMNSIHIKVPTKSKTNFRIIRLDCSNNDFLPTMDCGNEVSNWLSQYLTGKSSGLRLGYYDFSACKGFIHNYFSNSTFGMYTENAVLIINEKTFQDLEEKMDRKAEITQFRPNIVVDGEKIKPFAEDNWSWLKIGDTVFKNVDECIRCVITTIDQESGLRNINREPLKTLSKYRLSKGATKGPIMGVYLDVVNPGIISVGDDVCVEE